MSSYSNMGELSNFSIPGVYVSYSFGQQWFGTDNSATKCQNEHLQWEMSLSNFMIVEKYNVNVWHQNFALGWALGNNFGFILQLERNHRSHREQWVTLKSTKMPSRIRIVLYEFGCTMVKNKAHSREHNNYKF